MQYRYVDHARVRGEKLVAFAQSAEQDAYSAEFDVAWFETLTEAGIAGFNAEKVSAARITAEEKRREADRCAKIARFDEDARAAYRRGWLETFVQKVEQNHASTEAERMVAVASADVKAAADAMKVWEAAHTLAMRLLATIDVAGGEANPSARRKPAGRKR